jgi:hypothetical protein
MLILAQIIKKFPTFRRSLRFIAIFTKARKVKGLVWYLIIWFALTVRSCLPPVQAHQLEDYALSAVHNRLLKIVAATLHVWRLSSPSATWEHSRLWWQDTTSHGTRYAPEANQKCYCYIGLLGHSTCDVVKISFTRSNSVSLWYCGNSRYFFQSTQ